MENNNNNKQPSSQGNFKPKHNNGMHPYYYYPQMPYMPQGQRQSGFVPGGNQMPAQGQMQQPSPSGPAPGNGLPMEQSYIENILRLNLGKEATVYMTFENNEKWNAMVFRGIVEAAGRDHIILSDPKTGKRYLLLMIYLDYITFDEELNYQYPFGNPTNTMSTYPPR